MERCERERIGSEARGDNEGVSSRPAWQLASANKDAKKNIGPHAEHAHVLTLHQSDEAVEDVGLDNAVLRSQHVRALDERDGRDADLSIAVEEHGRAASLGGRSADQVAHEDGRVCPDHRGRSGSAVSHAARRSASHE